jgi:hypothetical protein
VAKAEREFRAEHHQCANDNEEPPKDEEKFAGFAQRVHAG